MGSEKARILVTGGSGFIASHLVEALLDQVFPAYDVAILARYGNVVKCERLRRVWDKLTVLEADVRNSSSLKIVTDWNPHLVFHLAAYNHVGESFRQWEECFDVNAKGTANLIEAVPYQATFVYTSSSEVYGLPTPAAVPWKETATPSPRSPYAVSKYAGELYCHMTRRLGRDIRVVRPFNTYGPYQSTKAVIPDLILQCLSGQDVHLTVGTQTREFNYVGDIVRGLLLAGTNVVGWYGPLNLGCGHEITIADLANMIRELCESDSELQCGSIPSRPNEIVRMAADNGAADEVLGWQPRESLETGLRKTIDWFRNHNS